MENRDLEETVQRLKRTVRLRDYAESVLEPMGKTFVCPVCNSGRGKNRTPAFNVASDGERWKCFSCDSGGDVFDLAGIVNGTNDFREKVRAVAEFAGERLEETRPKAPKNERKADYAQGRAREARYIAECRENASDPAAQAYLKARGFTEEEISRFGFGYDPRKRRVIVPWAGCDYYHIDRSVNDEEPKYLKPDSKNVGEQPLHNPDALESPIVYVVEGLFDALAIEATGRASIALAGTGSERTLRAISAREYAGTVVLMLDEDEKGQKAQEAAVTLAESLKLRYVSARLSAYTGAKDAAEEFAANRQNLETALFATDLDARAKEAEEAERAEREAMEALKVQDPGEIAAAIFACQGEERPVPSGFATLDDVLNGGLRPGLYVLGAVSSAGKTTFTVQMADAIAAGGTPVLFVTIEQSGRELVGKSLSRLMASRGYEGVSLWEMAEQRYRSLWPDAKTAVLLDALEEYEADIAPNLTVMAADEQPTVDEIRAAAFAVAVKRGTPPVVFVDYLQLLAARDERATEKQTADYNVSALRRLARDLRAPVVVISSLNRSSYSGVIEMESFKESGGIEYGADVLLALQPYRMAEKVAECGKDKEAAAKRITNEYRRESVRRSELAVLKNRNGRIPREPLPLTFHAASSLFTEGV